MALLHDSKIEAGIMKDSDNAMGGIFQKENEIDPSSLDLSLNSKGSYFKEQIEEMQRSFNTNVTSNTPDVGIVLDETAGYDIPKDFFKEESIDPRQKLIDEAQQLIQKGYYSKAIKVLNTILATSPDHHYALYLKALWNTKKKSKDYEAALEILLPLTKARLQGALESNVRILREKIKKEVLMHLVIEQILIQRTKNSHGMAARLQRLVALIPEEFNYRFMLAGTLMLEERFTEALEVIDRARVEIPGKHSDNLLQLRAEINNRKAGKAIEPALADFKQQKYSKALKKLNSVDKSIQKAPVVIIFKNYLQDLSGGFLRRMMGSKPAPNKITLRGGSKKEIETFCFLVCGKEIKLAQSMLQKKKFAQAETVLKPIVEKQLPSFPYANYLYSVAVFIRIQTSFILKHPPELESIISELKNVDRMLAIARKEPKIKDLELLSKSVDTTLKALLAARKSNMEMKWEIKLVEPIIKRYNNIMEGVSGGISNVRQYDETRKNFASVIKDIESRRRKIKHPKNKEVLEKLHQAASRNLKQLQEMEKDMKMAAEVEIVNKHWADFNKIAETLNQSQGNLNSDFVKNIFKILSTLKSDTLRDKINMKNPKAKEALDKLVDQLDQVLGMFKR